MSLESSNDFIHDLMSFLDVLKSDDLYNLFCDKEKIDADIEEIKGSNIKENRKNLLNELGLERERLFESFYDYYGDYEDHVKYLGDFIKSRGDSGKTYGNGMTLYDLIMDADKILHEKLYRIIFDTTGKDEIKDVISGKNLEVDKVLSRVSIMVNYFFEVRKHKIRNIIKKCIQNSPYFTKLINKSNCSIENYVNQFIVYYENDTLNYIFKELEQVKISKEYNSVDLDGKFGYFVTSIDLSLLAKFTSTLVFKGFLEFCFDKIDINLDDKNGINLDSEEIPEYRSVSYVYGKACGLFDEIFTNSKRDDILDYLDFSKLTIESIQKSLNVFGRILQNLKIHDGGARFLLSNASDSEKLEYLEQLFLKYRGRIFPQLKEYFFTEVSKLLFNGDDFQLSVNFDDISSTLREKYDKAKPHVGDVSKKQRDEMEKTFLKNEKDKFRTKFYDAFSKYSDFFDSLELKEFFVFIELFTPMLSDVQVTYKEKLNADYKNYVYETLEEKFIRSHDNAIKPKQPVASVIKKAKEPEVLESKESTNVVLEKKSLPNEDALFNKLKIYFGLGKDGILDKSLVRSLRNSFGEYKTSWYTKKKYGFDFDDGFFKILEEYGFVCIDGESADEELVDEESVDSGNSQVTQEDVGTENIECENLDIDAMKKLIDILDVLDSLEDNNEKVDYYIKAFELFYDIKDKEYIKAQILDSINPDGRILKGIESIFYRILNGKREVVRKLARTKKKYYRFDVAYNTGYRVVLNDQKGKSRRIIIDFVDHDTYMDRMMTYYNKKY